MKKQFTVSPGGIIKGSVRASRSMNSNMNINASSENSMSVNLSEYGSMERQNLIGILQAWESYGLPDDFYDNKVVPVQDKSNGYVYLTNSDHQKAALTDDGTLESFYITPYAGHEGFLDDLIGEYMSDPDDWDEEDIEYLRDLGADI